MGHRKISLAERQRGESPFTKGGFRARMSIALGTNVLQKGQAAPPGQEHTFSLTGMLSSDFGITAPGTYTGIARVYERDSSDQDTLIGEKTFTVNRL
jgi:hypothetical protein